MADAPPGAQLEPPTALPLSAGRDERGHGGDVIGIGRVTQAEKHRDEENDATEAPSDNPAIQSSSPNMTLVRQPDASGSLRGRREAPGR